MGNGNLNIRLIEAGEAELAAGLCAALLDELSGGKAPPAGELLPAAKEVLALETVHGLLAFDGTRAVGLMMLNECAAVYAGGKFGEISELYVAPDWRSKGAAAAMLAEAEALGRGKGWKRLEVGAPPQPEWARTLGFYTRNGFEETGPRLRRLL